MKKKLNELFIGKKTLKDRFLTAFCSSLALTFILFFFGPIDLSYNAKAYIDYTILDILPFCLAVWGITFSIFFLVSWIPGGKIHAFVCSLFIGTALAFYIQGNWMNPDLGALDGQMIMWQNYGDNAILNFLIFMIIVLIPFLILK